MRLAAGLLAAILVALALWRLEAGRDGLTITETRIGALAATEFRPDGVTQAPVVVIAHGFAGSQQLMQPFAQTLARNGYIAVTFDFPGHGRTAVPLDGGLADHAASATALLGALDAVVAASRQRADGPGRLALVGHSMGADIVVRYATSHPDAAATVAVSLFGPEVTPTRPRNLLVVVGALEPAMLRDEASRLVAMAAPGPAMPGVTYGDMATGRARRLMLASGVEHIGVLYSADSLAATLDWMRAVFGEAPRASIDRRAPWLGLLLAGALAGAWATIGLLPRVAPRPRSEPRRWRRLLPAAIAPALLTPLVLWPLPSGFLPLLLGDYLAAHFAVYGLLTALAVRLASMPRHPVAATSSRRALLVAPVTVLGIILIAWPLDRYVTAFLPTPARLPYLLAILIGTLAYALADARLVRNGAAPRGAAAVTKLCFLVSLAIAVALDPARLFFLVIILPAIALFFLVYGLLGGWLFRRSQDPLPGAALEALAQAWACAVIFPLIRS